MHKLYIPGVGDKIKLTKDWTFDLYDEDRNFSLMTYLKDPRPQKWSSNTSALPATIPAGAVLKIDRIYIRKGQSEFNSITFMWLGAAIPGYTEIATSWRGEYEVKVPRKQVRFWAKLADVNNIEFIPDDKS